MSDKSKIEWTDASWTPLRARNLKTGKIGWHCEHATTGCEFCYAEGMNKRLGTGLPFKPGHRKDIEIFLDEEMLLVPLRWKKPRMIFVCSMTDAFAEFMKDEWLDKMFAVMALCPQHTFQVLTKRAARMRDYIAGLSQRHTPDGNMHLSPQVVLCELMMRREIFADLAADTMKILGAKWPLPNVWLGVSTERQQEADERIPLLLQTPAAVRFISAEPLLGPIDLNRIPREPDDDDRKMPGFANVERFTTSALYGEPGLRMKDGKEWFAAAIKNAPCLDWVIVGGESGSRARPFNIEWADDIVAQCAAADVPCFVKQLGSVPMSDGYPLELHDRKGGDEAEWPERLNVRQFPQAADRGSPVMSIQNQEQKLSVSN